MLGAMIQMYISAAYDGGLEAFDKDFNLFITPNGEVVFAPKSDIRLKGDFKERLEEMAEGMSFKPLYPEASNFDGMSMEEAQESLDSELRERLEQFSGDISLQVNQALFDVLAPEMEQDSEEGQALIKNLSTVTGVVNIRIQFSDDTFLSISDDTEVEEEEQVNPKFAKLSTGRPERDTIISQDDHLNLQIALGQCQDVNDFIASM